MDSIIKELANAVVRCHTYIGGEGVLSDVESCAHCDAEREYAEFDIKHEPNCIVIRAKMILTGIEIE